MSKYRGYFMKDNHIVAPTVIEATEDAQAMLKASELLSTSRFVHIEVWHETRIVGSLSAPAPSHEQRTGRATSTIYAPNQQAPSPDLDRLGVEIPPQKLLSVG